MELSAAAVCPGKVPSVQTHSRLLFLRPATGVSGQASLSDSDEESRLSPVWALAFLGLMRCGRRRLRSGEVTLVFSGDRVIESSVGCSSDNVDSDRKYAPDDGM